MLGGAVTRITMLGSLLVALAGAGLAQAPSTTDQARALLGVRFVAYSPGPPFDPFHQPQVAADPEVVRRELRQLRVHFDGLVTYGLGLGQDCIPRIAQELGYRAVILGVWDPGSVEELDVAARLADEWRDLVVAVCVGNEGLTVRRDYTLDDVSQAIDRLHIQVPGVLCTTSEPVLPLYQEDPRLRECGDFLAPNVHPFWSLARGAPMDEAVGWALQQIARLAQEAPGRVILAKETGWPSGGRDDCTPEREREFWQLLLARKDGWPADTGFVVFEACDLPGKATGPAPFEAYWGMFTTGAAAPKPVMDVFPPLPLSGTPITAAAPPGREPAKPLPLKSPLLCHGDTVLAPLAELAEPMGFTVTAEGGRLVLRHGDTSVTAVVGQETIDVGGRPEALAAPCAIVDGVFYAPLRILEPLLGATLTPPEGTRPAIVTAGNASWELAFANSETLTVAGWEALDARRYDDALAYAETCLKLYLAAAQLQQKDKAAAGGYINWQPGDPDDQKQQVFGYGALNDCASCEFITLKVNYIRGDRTAASAAGKVIKDELWLAEVWDPRGWFWKPAIGAATEFPGIGP